MAEEMGRGATAALESIMLTIFTLTFDYIYRKPFPKFQYLEVIIDSTLFHWR
jgi:hypothetical protein